MSIPLGQEERVAESKLPRALETTTSASSTFRGAVVSLLEIQRQYAAWAHAQLGGKKVLTAEKLGIDLRTLGKLLASSPTDRDPRDP